MAGQRARDRDCYPRRYPCRPLDAKEARRIGEGICERYRRKLMEVIEHHRAERLAEVDPGNAEWKHGRAMALSRFSGVLIGQGALHEALPVLKGGLAAIKRLKAQSPVTRCFTTSWRGSRT
jgi:hypothetical protein